MRRDLYEKKPAGMDNYLSAYGWHFSKKMSEWGISMIEGYENKRDIKTKDEIERMLEQCGAQIPKGVGYDALYVYYMLSSDLHLPEGNADLIRYVGYWLNDKDGYEGMHFTRFYADCIGKGMPILWEEMM